MQKDFKKWSNRNENKAHLHSVTQSIYVHVCNKCADINCYMSQLVLIDSLLNLFFY